MGTGLWVACWWSRGARGPQDGQIFCESSNTSVEVDVFLELYGKGVRGSYALACGLAEQLVMRGRPRASIRQPDVGIAPDQS
jgi:hypothetical protein